MNILQHKRDIELGNTFIIVAVVLIVVVAFSQEEQWNQQGHKRGIFGVTAGTDKGPLSLSTIQHKRGFDVETKQPPYCTIM